MKLNDGLKLDFKDVLIEPKRSFLSSRADVDIIRRFKVKINNKVVENRITGFPVIAANMDTVGTISIAKELRKYGAFTALHKHYDVETLVDFFMNTRHWGSAFYTVGSNKKDFEKLRRVRAGLKEKSLVVAEHFPTMLCIDVANGYTQDFCDTVKLYREHCPNAVIMAGNVVTPNMVEELINCGANILKIGIGSGATCLTRVKSAIGFPQWSATVECADAAHGLGALICSDGGCVVPGDVCKAFGAGADFVMLGGMFSGTDECEGEWEYHTVNYDTNPPSIIMDKTKKKALKFYGMSSKEAMEKHNGGVASHRTSEGKCVSVPYKGSVKDVILDIQGGVRSACTYVGAESLKHFSKCCTFNRVTIQENRVFS